ncbi:MAG: hypothetical protein H0V76_08080 [Blastocatellia bacterium]|nr:hypothetical protein [Blastocatellia bacterium]
MGFDQNSAAEKAKEDLSKRLGIDASKIETASVSSKEFPDMSLGAPVNDEMSAQMIAYGWEITLRADGSDYHYRGDKYQLRLKDYKGSNHIVVS